MIRTSRKQRANDVDFKICRGNEQRCAAGHWRGERPLRTEAADRAAFGELRVRVGAFGEKRVDGREIATEYRALVENVKAEGGPTLSRFMADLTGWISGNLRWHLESGRHRSVVDLVGRNLMSGAMPADQQD